MKKPLDFIIDINENRDIKILQITDLQPVDPTQQRYPDRLHGYRVDEFTYEMKYKGMFYYIEKLIKDNNPDLILVTGDIVYGEFDDNGSNLIEISKFINSFGIPWAPVFGNHDNESKKGAKWQCETFISFSHCFFSRGNVTGNGNYNIGIKRNGKLINVIYMLDSNGCYNCRTYSYLEDYPPYNLDERLCSEAGIFNDQLAYIDKTSKAIDAEVGYNVPKMAAFHIPPKIMSDVAYQNGYQKDAEFFNKEKYTLGVEVEAKNGDFGTKHEIYSSFPTNGLWDILKNNYFTHVFVGHDHINDISLLCDGIRVTFGVKTGTFDYHEKSGGTLITIKTDDKINIEHQYIDIIE